MATKPKATTGKATAGTATEEKKPVKKTKAESSIKKVLKPAKLAAQKKDAAKSKKEKKAKSCKKKNPKTVCYNKADVSLKQLLKDYEELKKGSPSLNKFQKKAIRRYRREEALKPYQAELIRMQKCLEKSNRRMIILFEGRDAAGKGGTIRRVTRYMNEKHYRVVAMAKPTEYEKTQWFFQKYIAQLPRGGEVVLFDRSW